MSSKKLYAIIDQFRELIRSTDTFDSGIIRGKCWASAVIRNGKFLEIEEVYEYLPEYIRKKLVPLIIN